MAKLTTCDVIKRLLEMKKGLERVVQRKVLRVSRGYQKGDCEFAVFWDLVPCGLTEGY